LLRYRKNADFIGRCSAVFFVYGGKMLLPSHSSINSKPLARPHGHHKAHILQSNIPHDTSGELHHSVAEVARFLKELIALADQQAPGAPVLELQIGEIQTRTSLECSGQYHYLSVTALLPRCEQPHYLPSPFTPPAAQAGAVSNIEFLWHADEGRYIAVC
jgi:hypothetical protein